MNVISRRPRKLTEIRWKFQIRNFKRISMFYFWLLGWSINSSTGGFEQMWWARFSLGWNFDRDHLIDYPILWIKKNCSAKINTNIVNESGWLHHHHRRCLTSSIGLYSSIFFQRKSKIRRDASGGGVLGNQKRETPMKI